jgi:hypothetical protein
MFCIVLCMYNDIYIYIYDVKNNNDELHVYMSAYMRDSHRQIDIFVCIYSLM